MQRIHQTAALSFIVLSTLIAWESWSLEYYSSLGPGPGFFPFWLSICLGALSLVWLIQASRSAGKPAERTSFPDRSGIVRILYILASLTVVASIMNLIGFQLAMFAFLAFLLIIVGKQKIWISFIIALFGSSGIYHLFGRYLDVHLPVASLAILAKLGL